MLSPVLINDMRAIIDKSLAAGLIQRVEIPGLSRLLGALEVEERIFREHQASLAMQAKQEKQE